MNYNGNYDLILSGYAIGLMISRFNVRQVY